MSEMPAVVRAGRTPAVVRPQMQFATLEQQTETAALGMWLFLATEILFFGGLLLSYAIFRHAYPAGFAEAGRETELAIGTVNTLLLLTSGAAMAGAVQAVAADRGRLTVMLLLATAVLGLIFVGLKGFEWFLDYQKHEVPGLNFRSSSPHAAAIELFFFLYFMMTSVHALHMSVGIAVVLIMAVRTYRGDFSSVYYSPLEVTGLYWGFVDLVWIFLYPIIYLAGRSG